MFNHLLAPKRKPGMTDDDARLAAILPPVGHRIPAPPLTDTLLAPFRTARLLAYFFKRKPILEKLTLGSPAMRDEMHAVLARMGITVEVHGFENLQAGGQVLMWNQTSHLDHPVLAEAIPVPFRSTYNVEVSKFPIYGDWLRRQNHYFIDRFNEAQWRASLAEAAAWVRSGGTVTVSPEGTRSWDGTLLPMKRGSFILAIQSGQPIVPVVVRGAHEALPRGRFTVKPGLVTVTFGKPISTEGYTEESRKPLEERVAEALRS